jgi:methenyltetrahydrofolate cyclohydrolase
LTTGVSDISEISHKAFGKILDSHDFSTGGGSAAAIAGAMAAALVAMVVRLSLNKDYGLPPDEYTATISEAEELKEKLLGGAERDYAAFAYVKEAYALPKKTEEEKMNRAKMIEKAFIGAASVPAENASSCKRVYELTALLKEKSNPAAVSDLAVARDLSLAALKGCQENIRVNLPAIKDQVVIQQLQEQICALDHC